jgi:acyl-coenzyme A thioesterase PaaI-like protein
MSGYIDDHTTVQELERQTELYTGFTQSVRELVDATIRTEVDDEEIRAAQAEIEAITARLRARQLDGSFGVRFSSEGFTRPWGNAVMGLRNPVAPPLLITNDPSGRASSRFHLGAAYEGPPGLVHGGVSALLLDQLVGQAAAAGGHPGMTGTLTVKYHRGTPLGDLYGEAEVTEVDGPKTFVRGELGDADGATVTCEAIMILPRWAREKLQGQEVPRMFE